MVSNFFLSSPLTPPPVRLVAAFQTFSTLFSDTVAASPLWIHVSTVAVVSFAHARSASITNNQYYYHRPCENAHTASLPPPPLISWPFSKNSFKRVPFYNFYDRVTISALYGPSNAVFDMHDFFNILCRKAVHRTECILKCKRSSVSVWIVFCIFIVYIYICVYLFIYFITIFIFYWPLLPYSIVRYFNATAVRVVVFFKYMCPKRERFFKWPENNMHRV